MLKGISLKTTHYFFYKFNYILKMYYLKQYNYINQLHHIKIKVLHICEKSQYQLHVNPTADKCLCFCCIDTIPLLLNLRFQVSSYILKFSTRFQKALDRFSHNGTNENRLSLLSHLKHAENVQIEFITLVGLINIIFKLVLRLCL